MFFDILREIPLCLCLVFDILLYNFISRYASATPSPAGQITTMKSKSPKWRRVVFKISGAALACTGPHNIDPKVHH